jgi:hypothetical protein
MAGFHYRFRGEQATKDMKHRIQKLKEEGVDVVDSLWKRMEEAEMRGNGYSYEFADSSDKN